MEKQETFTTILLNALDKRLDALTWKCKGCKFVDTCGQATVFDPSPKFCFDIIEAAILEKNTFEKEPN